MTKSRQQRQKELKKRQEKAKKEKVREKKRMVQAISNRLDVRFSKLSPVRWDGELDVDAALFCPEVASRLPGELVEQLEIVKSALRELCVWDAGEASERLSQIPRNSPFSDWRIFLRGFVAWKQRDLNAAEEAWKRLDATRRPRRIADALTLSLKDNLTELKQTKLAQQSTDDEFLGRCDLAVFNHAKTVRQALIDRVALREAREITTIPLHDEEGTVFPEHIEWLRSFTGKYEKVDPELVEDLHIATILRAGHGCYTDMFSETIKNFRGPVHDRQNEIARSRYECDVGDMKKGTASLLNYIEKSLPKNGELTPALRAALASHLYVMLGNMENDSQAQGVSFVQALFGMAKPPHPETRTDYYERAIAACPENADAYDCIDDLYKEYVQAVDVKVAEKAKFDASLADLNRRRLEHLPDDVDVRLKLIDYYLDNGKSNLAQPHVDWFTGMPHKNPLAGALQWKCLLFEAFRMSGRKTELSKAPEALNKAFDIWPAWLDRTLYYYVQAALKVRLGEKDAFDAIAAEHRSPSKVADSVLRLAAAQLASFPAADVKPLRAVVDGFVDEVASLTIPDLLPLASFFWDMKRTKTKYPSYRMHGRKFLNKLERLLSDLTKPVDKVFRVAEIQGPLMALASDRCVVNQSGNFYFWVTHIEDPVLRASVIVCTLNQDSSAWAFEKNKDHAVLLAAEAKKIEDPFYSFFLMQEAERFLHRLEASTGRFSVLEKMFNQMGGGELIDIPDDDDDEEEEFF